MNKIQNYEESVFYRKRGDELYANGGEEYKRYYQEWLNYFDSVLEEHRKWIEETDMTRPAIPGSQGGEIQLTGIMEDGRDLIVRGSRLFKDLIKVRGRVLTDYNNELFASNLACLSYFLCRSGHPRYLKNAQKYMNLAIKFSKEKTALYKQRLELIDRHVAELNQ